MGEQEDVTAKREAARRARRLATQMTHDEDRQRALSYAAELEKQADALVLAAQAADKIVSRIDAQVQDAPSADVANKAKEPRE